MLVADNKLLHRHFTGRIEHSVSTATNNETSIWSCATVDVRIIQDDLCVKCKKETTVYYKWKQAKLVHNFIKSHKLQSKTRDYLKIVYASYLVSWRIMSPFSPNTAISETKGQGWKVIFTQWRKASDILTSTLAAFLFSSHPKKERDREVNLNYYASAYKRGDNYHIARQK